MTDLALFTAAQKAAASSLNANFDIVKQTRQFTKNAGEAILIRDAIVSGFYQADGGIKLDTLTDFAVSSPTGVQVDTTFTVGNHPNRVLVIFVYMGSSHYNAHGLIKFDGVTTDRQITGGQDYINAGYNGSNSISMHTLVNPSIGAHTLSFEPAGISANGFSYQIVVRSYYNCAQSSTFENFNLCYDQYMYGNDTADNWVGATPTVDGALVIAATLGNGFTTHEELPFNVQSVGSYISDSGVVFPKQPAQVHVTSMNGFTGGMGIVIKPFSPAIPTFRKASALNISSSTYYSYKPYKLNVVGFAENTVAQDESLDASVAGVVSGFSGLTPLAKYYLSDTAGLISTTPGTNSKLVGMAIDSANLLITNT
jgi:hypothetical protein